MGAAFGSFVGGVFGDMFSDPPTATSIWHYNPLTGESHEVYSDSDDGGNLDSMRSIAKGIIEQSENLIEMQGGERLPTDIITHKTSVTATITSVINPARRTTL